MVANADEALKIVGWILLPNVGGVAGNYIVSAHSKRLAAKLSMRPILPSGRIQIALWTTFNIGIGYAAYLVFRDGNGMHGPARLPMAAYAACLCYTWAWPPLFYDQIKFPLALMDATLLTGTVGLLGHMYRPINQTASKIMIPCFLWSVWVALFNLQAWCCSKKLFKRAEP